MIPFDPDGPGWPVERWRRYKAYDNQPEDWELVEMWRVVAFKNVILPYLLDG